MRRATITIVHAPRYTNLDLRFFAFDLRFFQIGSAFFRFSPQKRARYLGQGFLSILITARSS